MYSENKLSNWLDYISTPKTFNKKYAICPYLKKYRSKVKIVESDCPESIIESYLIFREDLDLEAIVIHGFKYEYEKINNILNYYNELGEEKNMYLLAMRPEDDINNYPHQIIIIQKIDTLNNSRNELRNKTDFYDYYRK